MQLKRNWLASAAEFIYCTLPDKMPFCCIDCMFCVSIGTPRPAWANKVDVLLLCLILYSVIETTV